MAKRPWFKFFHGDWLAGTRDLNACQTGVYITLLAKIYDAGGPIDNDLKRLSKACGLKPAQLKSALDLLIKQNKIKLLEDGRLCNPRAMKELKEQERISGIRRDANGSHQNRKTKENQQDKTAIVSKSESDRKITPPTPPPGGVAGVKKSNGTNGKAHEPDLPGIPPPPPPEPPKPTLVAVSEVPDGFQAFWLAYPTRPSNPNRKNAIRAYSAAIRRGATPARLVAAAKAYTAELKARNKLGSEFVAMASTWLNGDRWNDHQTKENLTPERRAELLAVLRG